MSGLAVLVIVAIRLVADANVRRGRHLLVGVDSSAIRSTAARTTSGPPSTARTSYVIPRTPANTSSSNSK